MNEHFLAYTYIRIFLQNTIISEYKNTSTVLIKWKINWRVTQSDRIHHTKQELKNKVGVGKWIHITDDIL